MSRSKKKYPLHTDYSKSHTPFAKRQASKRVRRYNKILAGGAAFKKLFCSWNIFDYKYVSDEEKGFRK